MTEVPYIEQFVERYPELLFLEISPQGGIKTLVFRDHTICDQELRFSYSSGMSQDTLILFPMKEAYTRMELTLDATSGMIDEGYLCVPTDRLNEESLSKLYACNIETYYISSENTYVWYDKEAILRRQVIRNILE